jgi:hypothetical protein
LVPDCSTGVSASFSHSSSDNAIWGVFLTYGSAAPLNIDTVVCTGTPVQLNVAGGGSVTWNPTTGLSCDTCFNPVATDTINTTYVATVSGAGCSPSISDTFRIRVNNGTEILSAQASPSVICAGDTVHLQAVNAVTTVWSPANGLSCTNCNNPVATPATSVTYVANMTNCGVSTVDSVTITVHDTVSLTVQANPLTICAGDSVHLNATSSATVTWSPSTGLACSVCNSTAAAPTASTVYYASVSSGCGSGLDSVSVTVNPLPNVQAYSDTSRICASDSALICATAGFAHYAWNAGDTVQCFHTNLAGNYYVTVTDAHNCSAVSNHTGLTVIQQPPVTISQNGDTLQAYNAVTYQWYLNGQPIPGATSHIFIANSAGSYSVAISDTNGCTAVSNPVIVSGIHDLENNTVQVYPNPTSDGWNITVDADLIGSKLEIFDVEGRKVYATEISETRTAISWDAARGVYLLRIHSLNGELVKKLVRL